MRLCSSRRTMAPAAHRDSVCASIGPAGAEGKTQRRAVSPAGSEVWMRSLLQYWPFWALMSALFAAMTALFAKIGVSAIDSDFATLVRTFVILLTAGAIVAVGGHWTAPSSVPGRAWLALILSGLATGGSWLCYFRALKLGDASRVAPVDKLSVVLVTILAALLLGERLSPTGWLGVVLIAAGAGLVAFAG